MNTTHLFEALAIAVVLSVSALAQHVHEAQQKDSQSQQNTFDMMGRPTFEQTTDGLSIHVWLITQTEHKIMMKDHGMMGGEMKKHHDSMGAMHGNTGEEKDHQMMDDQMQHDGKGMNEEMTASMLVGTHHIMVIVEDEATKTDRESSEVEVKAVSPTGESATATLTRMMKHFGGGLTLDENGQYTITVVVRDDQRVVPAGFAFEVRSIND